MQDAPLVGVVDRAGRGSRSTAPPLGDRTIAVEPGRQGITFHELHAEKVISIVLAHLKDGHDVGMVEIGDRLGLGANRRMSASVANSPDRIIFGATSG